MGVGESRRVAHDQATRTSCQVWGSGWNGKGNVAREGEAFQAHRFVARVVEFDEFGQRVAARGGKYFDLFRAFHPSLL